VAEASQLCVDTEASGEGFRYEELKGARGERLVSGSDDFTMFLWEPEDGKKPLARMTGHQQLINQASLLPGPPKTGPSGSQSRFCTHRRHVVRSQHRKAKESEKGLSSEFGHFFLAGSILAQRTVHLQRIVRQICQAVGRPHGQVPCIVLRPRGASVPGARDNTSVKSWRGGEWMVKGAQSWLRV
jgi:hypothetical protein